MKFSVVFFCLFSVGASLTLLSPDDDYSSAQSIGESSGSGKGGMQSSGASSSSGMHSSDDKLLGESSGLGSSSSSMQASGGMVGSSGDSLLGSGGSSGSGSNGVQGRLVVSFERITQENHNTTIPLDPIKPENFPVSISVSCFEGEVFDAELNGCRPSIIVDSPSAPDCNATIALSDSEFEYAGGNLVLFRGEILEIHLNSSDGKPVVCVNLTQNGTRVINRRIYAYPPGYDVILFVGCSLSFVSCCLVLLSFCLFKELRTLPSKILMNITVTILATNLLIILTVSVGINISVFCDAVAILLHFSILSQFMWMTVMCAEVAYSFYLASQLIRYNSENACKKLVFYSIVSWSIPFLIVGISVVLNYSTSDLIAYGSINSRSCLIGHIHSALVTYLVPVAISTLVQCILFIFVGIFLCMSCHRKHAEGRTQRKSTPYSRVVFALFFATNIIWLLGFMAVLVNTPWSWYPFTILQSFQGFIIFVGFCCTKKVLKLYLSVLSPIQKCVVPTTV